MRRARATDGLRAVGEIKRPLRGLGIASLHVGIPRKGIGRTLCAPHYPPSAYLMSSIRWNVFDSGGSVVFRTNGTQPGYDSSSVAQQATSAWTDEPNSNIRLSIGGTTSAGFVDDDQNTIVFNASSGVPSGAIGYAQIRGGGQHTFAGETFYTATEGDVIMR